MSTKPILAEIGVWPPPPEPGYVYLGQVYPRILYGDEIGVLGADVTSCPGYETSASQYHIRGCVVEQCPVCGDCTAVCLCTYERSLKLC